MHFRTFDSSLRAPQGPWDTRDPLLGVDETEFSFNKARQIRNYISADDDLRIPALEWTNLSLINISQGSREVPFRDYAAALPGGISGRSLLAGSSAAMGSIYANQELPLEHARKRIAEETLGRDSSKQSKLRKSDLVTDNSDSTIPPSSRFQEDDRESASRVASLSTSEERRAAKVTPARVSLYSTDCPEETVAAVAAAAKTSSQDDSDDGSPPSGGLSSSLYQAAMAVLQDDQKPEGNSKKPHRVSFQVEERASNKELAPRQQYMISMKAGRNQAIMAFPLSERLRSATIAKPSLGLHSPPPVPTSRTWTNPLTPEEHKLRFEKVMNESVRKELYESQVVTDLGPGGVKIPASLLVKPLRPYDVLCGRDQLALLNVGNRRLRILINLYMERYMKAENQHDRTELHKQIRDTVIHAGGSFLKLSDDGKDWIVMKKSEAREKVAQAMRDQVKILRRKRKELRKHARIIGQLRSEDPIKVMGGARKSPPADESTSEQQGEQEDSTRQEHLAIDVDDTLKEAETGSSKDSDSTTESEGSSDDDEGEDSSCSASELVAMDDMNVMGPPQVQTVSKEYSHDEKRKRIALASTAWLAARVRSELAAEEKARNKAKKIAKLSRNEHEQQARQLLSFMQQTRAQAQSVDSINEKNVAKEKENPDQEVRVVPKRRNSNSSTVSSSSSSSSSSSLGADRVRLTSPQSSLSKGKGGKAAVKACEDSDSDEVSMHNQSPPCRVSVSS